MNARSECTIFFGARLEIMFNSLVSIASFIANIVLSTVFVIISWRRCFNKVEYNGKHTIPVVCVCPVKGRANAVQWQALLEYKGGVDLVITLESECDAAYAPAIEFASKHTNVTVSVAGMTVKMSQKVHNLVHALRPTNGYVCFVDDDVHIESKNIEYMANALASDERALAVSGFSCDIPDRYTCLLDHVACFFRLILDVSVSSQRASAIWGGCCMMRGADLREDGPIITAWRDAAYSDDWILTELSRTLKRPILNPPLLLPSLVRFDTWASLYSFLHRQAFVAHTHMNGTRMTVHRVVSSFLTVIMVVSGTLFSTLPFLSVYAWVRSNPSSESVLISNAVSFLVLAGTAGCAIMSQRAVAYRCTSPSNEVLKKHQWNIGLAVLAFPVFAVMIATAAVHSTCIRTVTWGNIQYKRHQGRVHRIRRLDVDGRDPLMPLTTELAAKMAARVNVPDGFLWGSTTAAGHVEGGLQDTNWKRWEARKSRPDGRSTIKNDAICATACDMWNRTLTDDIPHMVRLGLTSYRFSIEWSRVMPSIDHIDEGAINVYIEWCDALNASNIEPCVTLLHFTTPGWFEDLGGWRKRENVVHFNKFVDAVVPRLSCRVWCTINEPVGSAINGYVAGIHPPGMRLSYRSMAKCILHQHMGHAHASKAILAHAPDSAIMVATNMAPFEPFGRLWCLACFVSSFNYLWNWAWVDVVVFGRFTSNALQLIAYMCGVSEDLKACKGSVTHIGVNAYTRIGIEVSAWQCCFNWTRRRARSNMDYGSRAVPPPHSRNQQQTTVACCFMSPHTPGYEMSDTEWDQTPSVLERLLTIVWSRWSLPIYVTESGCADSSASDDMATRYLVGCATAITNAIGMGADVRGYYYFSWVDNFEWAEGYDPRFGLCAMERGSLNRIDKPRARMYRKIIHGSRDSASVAISSNSSDFATTVSSTSAEPVGASPWTSTTTSATSVVVDVEMGSLKTDTPTTVSVMPTTNTDTRQCDIDDNSSNTTPPTSAIDIVIVDR